MSKQHDLTNTDDEDWEYEYDEVETEDFYITLDISNTPAARVGVSRPRSRLRAGNPIKLQSRLRALNANRRDIAEPEETTDTPQPSTIGEMQIIGLHTSNPLVMYNDQLLSCKWAATIGTDMFFAKPSAEAEPSDRPLRSLPALDLLAISSVKLTANAAVLQPRESLSAPAQGDQGQMGDAMDWSESVPPTLQETPNPPVETTPSAPTSFLAKLNEAKAKRGENTRLIVSQTPNGPRLVAEKSDGATAPRAETDG